MPSKKLILIMVFQMKKFKNIKHIHSIGTVPRPLKQMQSHYDRDTSTAYHISGYISF